MLNKAELREQQKALKLGRRRKAQQTHKKLPENRLKEREAKKRKAKREKQQLRKIIEFIEKSSQNYEVYNIYENTKEYKKLFATTPQNIFEVTQETIAEMDPKLLDFQGQYDKEQAKKAKKEKHRKYIEFLKSVEEIIPTWHLNSREYNYDENEADKYKSLEFTCKKKKTDTNNSNLKYQSTSYPYIPTKQERKRIKKIWKIIQDNPSAKDVVSLRSTLYNNEVPFEMTIEELQSMEDIDFILEEYKELLYFSFDKYDLSEKVIQDLEKQSRKSEQIRQKRVKVLKRKPVTYKTQLSLLTVLRNILNKKLSENIKENFNKNSEKNIEENLDKEV